jgi:hypothetical protein
LAWAFGPRVRILLEHFGLGLASFWDLGLSLAFGSILGLKPVRHFLVFRILHGNLQRGTSSGSPEDCFQSRVGILERSKKSTQIVFFLLLSVSDWVDSLIDPGSTDVQSQL